MTSFNAAAVSINLDEYYEHFVVPKPEIPKSYPGYSGQKKNRQAARLQSYKDNAEENVEGDDDDDNGDAGEIEQVETASIDDEFNSSIQDTNGNQIDFEINEFNQLYEDANSQNETETAVVEAAERRLKGTSWNGNQNAERGKQSHRKQHHRYSAFKSSNRKRIPVQQRLGKPIQIWDTQHELFPMRDNHLNNDNNRHEFYNLNNNNGHYNPSNFNHSYNTNTINDSHFNYGNNRQQVSMNLNNDFLMEFNHVNNSPLNSSSRNNFAGSNSLSSLITAANQIANNSNIFNNNLQSRLGPQHRGRTLNNQEQSNGQQIVASNSLRLADLMNLDKKNWANMNVAEVAKNAIMLLSAYKPTQLQPEEPQSNFNENPLLKDPNFD